MYKEIIAGALLVALLLAAGFANTNWINQHSLIDGISEGDLVEKMVSFASLYENGNYNSFYKFIVNWEYKSDTPNLLFYLGLQSWKVFGREYRSLLHLMTVIYILLILGTYLVTRQVGGSPWAGLAAAVLISLYPMIYELSRAFTTYPLTTMIFCYTMIALIRCKDFTNLKWSVVFGLLLGINFLAERGSPPLFALGPLAWVLYRVFKALKQNRSLLQPVLRNLIIAGAISSVIALPYLLNYVFLNLAHNVELINQDWFDPKSPYYGRTLTLEYYLVELDRVQAGPFAGILFLAMLPFVIRNRPQHAWALFTWLAVPFAIFSIIAQKAETYTLMWMPAVAAVTGIGLTRLKPKGVGVLALLPVLGLSLFHFVDLYNNAQWSSSTYKQEMNPIAAWAMNKDNFVRPRPMRKGYRHFEVAKELADKYKDDGFVMMVHYNPDSKRDDRMDMAFLVTIHEPKICQYYPSMALFDHEDDVYLDTLVFRFDHLKKAGCPFDEQWEEELRSWCAYTFVVNHPEVQAQFTDRVKTLPIKPVGEPYRLGKNYIHEEDEIIEKYLKLNLYEVTCP